MKIIPILLAAAFTALAGNNAGRRTPAADAQQELQALQRQQELANMRVQQEVQKAQQQIQIQIQNPQKEIQQLQRQTLLQNQKEQRAIQKLQKQYQNN